MSISLPENHDHPDTNIEEKTMVAHPLQFSSENAKLEVFVCTVKSLNIL